MTGPVQIEVLGGTMEEQGKVTKKKERKGIADRHYLLVNIIMFVFLMGIILFTVLIQWPIDRKTTVTVENGTGEPCYFVLLSKDTNRYGTYTRMGFLGGLYVASIDGTKEEYWEAVRETGIARGLTEEEAKELVTSKKKELAMSGGYAIEMYRELVDVYFNKTRSGFFESQPDPEEFAPFEDWTGIAAYEDPEGYRFVHQNAWKAAQGETVVRWDDVLVEGPFKVLLYWPSSERYAVSGVLESKQYLDEFRVSVTARPEGVGKLSVENLSRKETIPLWIILLALVVSVAVEIMVAYAAGADQRQLKIVAPVSAVAHILLYVLLILTNNALMVGGILQVHYFVFGLAKLVLVPVLEMPLYVHFLRGKESREPGFRYCDFTLFVNWAPMILVVAAVVLLGLIFPTA